MGPPLDWKIGVSRGSGGYNDSYRTADKGGDGGWHDRNDYDGNQDTVEGNLPGYVPTPEYLQLRNVYGDWVYVNNCKHLNGTIDDNGVC